MNPNYNKMYKRALFELNKELYNKDRLEIELREKQYKRYDDYSFLDKVASYGRIVTLSSVVLIGASMFIVKECNGKDKNYNPKIEHLEDKIRGK